MQNRDLIGVDTITLGVRLPALGLDLAALARAPVAQPRRRPRRRDQQDHPSQRDAAFQYDPFTHRPSEQCTAAALRAEAPDVDLSLKRGSGGIPPSAYEHGFVTVGDLLKQLSTTYATPAEDADQAMSAAEAEARVVALGRTCAARRPLAVATIRRRGDEDSYRRRSGARVRSRAPASTAPLVLGVVPVGDRKPSKLVASGG